MTEGALLVEYSRDLEQKSRRVGPVDLGVKCFDVGVLKHRNIYGTSRWSFEGLGTRAAVTWVRGFVREDLRLVKASLCGILAAILVFSWALAVPLAYGGTLESEAQSGEPLSGASASQPREPVVESQPREPFIGLKVYRVRGADAYYNLTEEVSERFPLLADAMTEADSRYEEWCAGVEPCITVAMVPPPSSVRISIPRGVALAMLQEIPHEIETREKLCDARPLSVEPMPCVRTQHWNIVGYRGAYYHLTISFFDVG